MRKVQVLAVLALSAAVLWAGTAAEHLSAMDQTTRENALISLEWNGGLTSDMEYATNLWNAGRYTDAIALIETIEDEAGDAAVAVSWRTPILTPNTRWDDDVLVSSTGYSLQQLEMVLADNGNYFIIAHGDSGSYSRWFVHMSTDGGENWTETAYWHGGAYEIPSVDAAEMPNYVYVAYLTTSAPTTARLRRVFETDGTMDNVFSFVDVFTASSDLNEINMEPNRYSQAQMYIAAIDAAHTLYYYFGDTTGTSWSGVTTDITNADRGLDMDYGFMTGSSHILWMSYISTADSLCALSRAPGWGVHPNLDIVHSASFFPTAIAQHGDSVIIFFETPAYTLRYRITYNDGTTWNYGGGSIYTDSCGSMDVTGRGNEGWHMSFASFDATAVDEDVYYSTRTYPSGAWSSPQLVSEHDQFINYQTTIDYLGAPGVYGIAYIDDNYDIYFDRLDWTAVDEYTQNEIENRIVSLAPNPTRAGTSLKITNSKQGVVSVSLFDVAGRMVKRLMNETKAVGTYSINIETQNLAAGLYFVRVETPEAEVTKKMTVIK
jgi:hypothetical protein